MGMSGVQDDILRAFEVRRQPLLGWEREERGNMVDDQQRTLYMSLVCDECHIFTGGYE